MVLPASNPSAVRAFGADAAEAPVRVMIVDDSAVVRGLVSRWLEEEQGVQVVARHPNGQRAVDDVVASAPDVIILDVEMPVMDGLAALPLLLRGKPGVKVIMASTLTHRNAEVSLKALSLGATDYIPKPESNSGITTSDSFRRDLVQRVRVLGRLRPVTSPRVSAPSARTGAAAAAASPTLAARGTEVRLRPFSITPPRAVVIGSSTGGPQALARLINDISPSIGHVPVFITQHMPATFTAILAKHLADASGKPCREATHHEVPVNGSIYVAPGGHHMRLAAQGGRTVLALDQGPEINFCRPSVDPLFETAAGIYRGALLGIVLTGMGSDGANGVRAIAAAGGSVIAQDEATSVVWGMPGAAAHTGACSAVLPLGEIGTKIRTLLK